MLAAGVIDVRNAAADYPAIRKSAAGLLERECIDDIIAASFSRIFVDEYQDCGLLQHAIVLQLARILPTVALGDPMQAIFTFGSDPAMPWAAVEEAFPGAGELTTPWRWKNVGGEELGEWLLDTRKRLLNGDPIDLRSAPKAVTWIPLGGENDYARQITAAKADAPTKDGCILIIGDGTNPRSQQEFASKIPGAVTVEAVDLKDLVAFSTSYKVEGKDGFVKLLEFAQRVLTNIGAKELVRRLDSIIKGTAKDPPSEVESAALTFLRDRSFRSAVDFLVVLSAEAGVRIHRPAVLNGCIRAMQLSAGNPTLSFREAAIMVREENRFTGRALAARNVGSTLLLKGLEAEAVVILNADILDARNLYVAMTRGSMAVTVCSTSPTLSRTKPT
jgi:DNA helicase-2/ATP-dependent DNA helicase PcrA